MEGLKLVPRFRYEKNRQRESVVPNRRYYHVSTQIRSKRLLKRISPLQRKVLTLKMGIRIISLCFHVTVLKNR